VDGAVLWVANYDDGTVIELPAWRLGRPHPGLTQPG